MFTLAGSGRVAIDLLLDRGLLAIEDVVEGVEIRDTGGRNGGLQVEKADGTGIFVKWAHPYAAAAVAAEAAFYEACRCIPQLAWLAPLLPRLKEFRPEGPWLVCELVIGARPFFDSVRRGDFESFAVHARALGQALGRLHRLAPRQRRRLNKLLPNLPTGLPWPFELGRPSLDLRSKLHPAQEKMLQILQGEPELLAAVCALAARYDGHALIHGDLREANLLVGDANELRLIDWELLHWGDPAWDLGAVLEAHLELWLRAMPLDPAATAESRAARCAISWKAVAPGLRALLAAYRCSAGLSRADAAALLQRSVAFSAVHLLRSAWEHSATTSRLSTLAVLFLQVAANILADVRQATIRLYELRVPA